MKRILTLAVLVGALSCFAFSQGGGQGRQGGGQGGPGGARMGMGQMGGQGGLSLLTRKDVAKELALTAEQTSAFDAMNKKAQEERRARMEEMRNNGGGGNADPEARRAEQQKLQAEQRKEIAKVLTADQNKRFGEIEVQMMGSRALMNADVQKKLGITDSQKEKLQAAQQSQGQKMRDMMEEMRSGGGQPDQAKMQEAMKSMQDAIQAEMMKVLTDKQKTDFEAMKGKPFKADPNENTRRGGGGGIIG